mmetsp:Transcript_7590/g.17415  ORF Transcript_7590/g.17415 Transcript_7590/m.17415 type:complete len:207 (-) Transcript_7590:945-1565(-)
MMPSTPSSARLALESMFHVLCTLIWSPPFVMKCVTEPTVSFTIPSKSSMERRTPPITTLVDITLPERRLSILSLIVSVSSLITALVSRVSLSSTPLEVVLDLVWVLSFSRGSPLTTDANPSSPSLSLRPLRFLLRLSSLTTLSSPPTLSSSTLTAPSAWTTRPFTMCAGATLVLRPPLTPTLTDSSLRLFPLSLPRFASMEPSMWT